MDFHVSEEAIVEAAFGAANRNRILNDNPSQSYLVRKLHEEFLDTKADASDPTEMRNIVQALYDQKVSRIGTSETGITRETATSGDYVAIMHGCRVLVMPRKLDRFLHFQIFGDYYIEIIMFGKAAVCKEDNADEIVLV